MSQQDFELNYGYPVDATALYEQLSGKIKEHYGNVSVFEIHQMIGSHDLNGTLV